MCHLPRTRQTNLLGRMDSAIVVHLGEPKYALTIASIAPSTLASYRSALSHFSAYVSLKFGCRHQSNSQLHVSSWPVLDEYLASFIEAVHLQGLPASWAVNSFFGLRTFNPEISRQLAVSYDLMRRLRRARKSKSPPPLTWDLANLMAAWFVRRFDATWSLALLLAFDCYLRVEELLALRKCDISIPVAFPTSGSVGVILRKTKARRQQSVLIRRRCVALLVVGLVRRLPSETSLLFAFSSGDLRFAMSRASSALGLPHFVPHSCRHGGASQDLLALWALSASPRLS
jgi:integrase